MLNLAKQTNILLVNKLVMLGAKDQRVVTDHYQLWRLIVPIFLHGGAIHLGFTLCNVTHLNKQTNYTHIHEVKLTDLHIQKPSFPATIRSVGT